MVKIKNKINLLGLITMLLCTNNFAQAQIAQAANKTTAGQQQKIALKKAAIKKMQKKPTVASQIWANTRAARLQTMRIKHLATRIAAIEVALKKANIQVIMPPAKKIAKKAAQKVAAKVAQSTPNAPVLAQDQALPAQTPDDIALSNEILSDSSEDEADEDDADTDTDDLGDGTDDTTGSAAA